MKLFYRWRKLWMALGGTDSDAVLVELASHYAEPHRAYHTLNHVAECLLELNQFASVLDPHDYRLLEAAIWFHDVIYDPASKSNEAESATLASAHLRMAPLRDRREVERLILATTHAVEPQDRLEKVICSIDLAILGQPPARYAAYAKAIRSEYAAVPDEAYRTGRKAILERLLARPALYPEETLARQYDRQARLNLTCEIAELTSG